MKLEEIKTFVEEHKKEILIGTGVVVGGIVLVVTGKKLLKPRKAIISKPYKDLIFYEQIYESTRNYREGDSR